MPKKSEEIIRCSWANSNALMQQYHDEEWGVPVYDSRALWGKLILDGFQAGLSWNIILQKRENFRRAFKDFNPEKIACFTQKDVERLMNDETIIRSRLKILSAISNAQAFLKMQENGDDFSEWVWNFTERKIIYHHQPATAKSELSELISKELKRRGFKFVGPVIVYAWMQAVGIVNDHEIDCSFCKPDSA